MTHGHGLYITSTNMTGMANLTNFNHNLTQLYTVSPACSGGCQRKRREEMLAV
jgi:hypothetical protein